MAEGTKKRAAPKFKPVYAVMQVLDENGEPMEFDKNRINILVGSKDTEGVLDSLESNKFAFAKKVTL